MSSSAAVDPRWPKLLSLAVHELRTPMTVVAGYIRMLLKERAGPLPEQQRRLLEEAERSCARLSGLLAEASELAALESGTASFNRATIDTESVLRDAIASLPALPDRDVRVELQGFDRSPAMHGDATRLRTALGSVVAALRREVVTTDLLLVRARARRENDLATSRIAIGDSSRIDALENAGPEALTVFDEWRGGCGLSLAVARRIIDAHGGGIWSPADAPRSGAVIALPSLDSSSA